MKRNFYKVPREDGVFFEDVPSVLREGGRRKTGVYIQLTKRAGTGLW